MPQFDYTLVVVGLGAAVLGVTAGALGCFALLRRESLLGDAISHAALAGVAGAFLLTRGQAPLALLTGAALAGWAATAFAQLCIRRTHIKTDAALGIALSVFFGLGIVLLTYIQRSAGAGQAGLDKFLFGNASTLLAADVVTMALLGGLALAAVALLWTRFKLATFDSDFAHTLGLPVRLLDGVLLALIVVAIVVGLQTVGVVLMSAMLVAPAAAARQWTDRLGKMVLLAALLGALSGVSGAVFSAAVPRLPTGPTIVLIVSALTLLSFLLAPNRGLLQQALRARRLRHELELGVVLEGLLRLSEAHADPYYAHEAGALRTFAGVPVRSRLAELEDAGLVQRRGELWALTPAGLERAREEQG